MTQISTKESTDLLPFSLTEDGTKTHKYKIETLRTSELVIAFCGPIGSGVTEASRQFAKVLKNFDYIVVLVKLSRFIESKVSKYFPQASEKRIKDDKAFRFETLQTVGNYLRRDFGNNILSKLAIRKIQIARQKSKDENLGPRIAYIIESLKHPDETNLLRSIYGNMFYLIGVLCPQSIRESRLSHDKKIIEHKASFLIQRDRLENFEYGQRLIDTFKASDFYVANNYNIEDLKNPFERYVKLILGQPGVTPTIHEYAMYVAQSAALRSACISRQVGVSILSSNGEIICTGYNEVPKRGGHWSELDGKNDSRCYKWDKGQCFNFVFKKEMRNQIETILLDGFKSFLNDIDFSKLIPKTKKTKKGETTSHILQYLLQLFDDKETIKGLVDSIVDETRLKDLIEFSRSVHAEMDAIISASRQGISLEGCEMFSTTFPCHLCARHIIASGIKAVYYIEPYEKSLALTLHRDSIQLDPTEPGGMEGMVLFKHFEGVAPRQYLNLFYSEDERKKNGRFIEVAPRKAIPKIPEFLESHRDLESRIITKLNEITDLEGIGTQFEEGEFQVSL